MRRHAFLSAVTACALSSVASPAPADVATTPLIIGPPTGQDAAGLYYAIQKGWFQQARLGKPVDNPGGLPPRTVKHGSPAGKKFHQLTGRGDDWLDWDSNMFHFYGGTPIGDSMAVYEAYALDYYVDEWMRTKGIPLSAVVLTAVK